MKVIGETRQGYKVFKNINAGGEIFYHIADEPPIEEISSPDDIRTVAAYTVGSDETEMQVREQIVENFGEIE